MGDVRVLVSLETAYGSIAFFTSILHNVFLLYHVDLFVSVYKIDKTSFWLGEAIFLVWNSVNDPLFGWISDRQYLSGHANKEHSEAEVVFRRLDALQKNGPLLALTFLAFWLSWAYPWLQFIVCLCLYDGFLTMVDLHHSALLADLAVSNDARTRLNSACSVFSVLGSASVFLSYILWHKEDLTSFRIFCVVLSVISLTGFLVMSKTLKRAHAMQQKHFDASFHRESSSAEGENVIPRGPVLVKYIQQLTSHKNFLWFAAINLVQVFHCHFNSNFFPLFLENLLGNAISPTLASLLLGISFVAPHINNLYFLTLCRTWGVYSVIRILFVVKLLMAVLMMMFGPGHTLLLCIFIASNRVFTEGTCKLLSLVISDLVDEDYVINRRQQAVSALIFGTAALLSKPGQTMAPLIGTWVLALQTGHDIFQSGHETGSVKASFSEMTMEQQTVYKMGCFHLLVYIPVICATLQLLCWQKFSLRGARLHHIKTARRGHWQDHV